MEVVCSSEMSETFSITTSCQNPEENTKEQ
jgi:hypothetical protein